MFIIAELQSILILQLVICVIFPSVCNTAMTLNPCVSGPSPHEVFFLRD